MKRNLPALFLRRATLCDRASSVLKQAKWAMEAYRTAEQAGALAGKVDSG
jgi:hypothetical protein